MKNCEIKAFLCEEAWPRVRAMLEGEAHASYAERQIDTYFNALNGRLKLRESQTENYLIAYDRPDTVQPKISEVQLVVVGPGSRTLLKEGLTRSLGVLAVVDKVREVYLVKDGTVDGLVKFHLDRVVGLDGSFVEIEAQDPIGTVAPEELERRCRQAMRWIGVDESGLLHRSYSDMILEGLAARP